MKNPAVDLAIPEAAEEGVIAMRLELPFEAFTQELADQFRNDLAAALRIGEAEVRIISIRKGCVFLNMRLPLQQALQLVQAFKDAQREVPGDETDLELELREIFLTYNVADVKDTIVSINVNIQVRKDGREKRNRVLLFVHGWRSDERAFGLLPDILASEFSARKEMFTYPTRTAGHSPSIVYVARALDNRIQFLSQAERLNVSIIAHSMGGLVVRECVAKQWRSEHRYDQDISHMSFIASPFRGSSVASSAKIIADGISRLTRKKPAWWTPQLQELGDKSEWLFYMNVNWMKWLREVAPGWCSVRCIFGTDDMWVLPIQAQGDDPEATPILGATHDSIVNVTSETDETVTTLIRFLRESDFARDSLAPQRAASRA